MRSEVMSTPVVASVDGPVSNIVKSVRRWVAYRDTSTALSKLSRRELSDIGVDTSIDDFAWRIADDAANRR